MYQHLHPIAYPEHRQAGLVHPRRRHRRAIVIHGSWPTREDDALWIEVLNAIPCRVVWQYLTIDLGLAHPPRYEAAVLRPEVDDDDRLAFGPGCRVRDWQLPRLFLGDLQVR